MGMYSTYNWEDIEVKDKEALIKIKKEKGGEDWSVYDAITDEGELVLQEWCGTKIEGYWYNSTRDFLLEVAPFVEGFAEFSYEEGYDFRICFNDGVVIVKIQPSVEWADIAGLELTKEGLQ